MKSAEVIIVSAFKVHFLKEVTRQQLLGAINCHISPDKRKNFHTMSKSALLMPLAKALLSKQLIVLEDDCDLQNIKRDDIIVNGVL